MFDIDKIVGWYDKPRIGCTPTTSLFLGVYGWVQAFSNASEEADEETTCEIIEWAMHEPKGKHIVLDNETLKEIMETKYVPLCNH